VHYVVRRVDGPPRRAWRFPSDSELGRVSFAPVTPSPPSIILSFHHRDRNKFGWFPFSGLAAPSISSSAGSYNSLVVRFMIVLSFWALLVFCGSFSSSSSLPNLFLFLGVVSRKLLGAHSWSPVSIRSLSFKPLVLGGAAEFSKRQARLHEHAGGRGRLGGRI